MTTFRKLFLDHPASVQESYLEHAHFALGFSARLFLASLAALLHAVIPSLFERTASRMISEMYDQTKDRGRSPKKKAAEGLAALDN